MLATPGRAAGLDQVVTASMRGPLDASHFGVRPGALDDQSRVFQQMLEKSSSQAIPVFLPAGDYVVSNITLPKNVRLSGVAGATRIVYGGNGYLFTAESAELVALSDIVIDGANRWISDDVQALVDLSGVASVAIDNCRIVGSSKSAIALERVGGRISRNAISGAADVGIYSVEAARLEISGNTVTDCGNGGILVHRWQPAEDGTMVIGNRVERIGAADGGTGQHGNGINVFRADNVTVANNWIADCAFTAVRSNSGNNVQITGNHCLRSGETGIYSEFSFQGAVISSNIVDGAANGISIVNFNDGGRMAVCQGNIVRNLKNAGPVPGRPAGLRRRDLG